MALKGAWQLADLAAIDRALRGKRLPARVVLDGKQLESIDTSSAWLLADALRHAGITPTQVQLDGFGDDHRAVIERVLRLGEAKQELPRRKRLSALAQFGKSSIEVGHMCAGHVTFLGETAQAIAELVRHPSRLRLKELTVQFEQTGLNAIPVVALVTLLIGIVIAYLLGLQAEKYGANLLVVDGVGIGATREFAPIIVAVIVAGRSGAAFTAQLGSMRLGEETDAIRTLGLSPHAGARPAARARPDARAAAAGFPRRCDVASSARCGSPNPMLDITPTDVHRTPARGASRCAMCLSGWPRRRCSRCLSR